jgi:hypothetical protein
VTLDGDTLDELQGTSVWDAEIEAIAARSAAEEATARAYDAANPERKRARLTKLHISDTPERKSERARASAKKDPERTRALTRERVRRHRVAKALSLVRAAAEATQQLRKEA